MNKDIFDCYDQYGKPLDANFAIEYLMEDGLLENAQASAIWQALEKWFDFAEEQLRIARESDSPQEGVNEELMSAAREVVWASENVSGEQLDYAEEEKAAEALVHMNYEMLDADALNTCRDIFSLDVAGHDEETLKKRSFLHSVERQDSEKDDILQENDEDNEEKVDDLDDENLMAAFVSVEILREGYMAGRLAEELDKNQTWKVVGASDGKNDECIIRGLEGELQSTDELILKKLFALTCFQHVLKHEPSLKKEALVIALMSARHAFNEINTLKASQRIIRLADLMNMIIETMPKEN